MSTSSDVKENVSPQCFKGEGEVLLVCGDRNWTDRMLIRGFLEVYNPSLVIEGEAYGADTIAREEAEDLGIPVMKVFAEWDKYGKGAGHIRNGKMLDGEPDLVLAFHSKIEESKGTANCLSQAEDRDIEYFLVEDRWTYEAD